MLGGTLIALWMTLVVPTIGAQQPGRYAGEMWGEWHDGPHRSKLLMTFSRGNGGLTCAAGQDSYDVLTPCEHLETRAGKVSFGLPWGGGDGIIFELDVNSDRLGGTIRPTPGALDIFQHLDLRRTGDLTLSDVVPRIPFEFGERSQRLLQLRKAVLDRDTSVVGSFWRELAARGTPLIEDSTDSSHRSLVTFVWKGAANTKSVLVMWPEQWFAVPDQYFMSHVEGTDVWFKTLRVRNGTRFYYQVSPNDPLQDHPEGSWPRRAQDDPLNRSKPSLLELPGAPPQVWYRKRQTLRDTLCRWKTLSTVPP